MVRSSSFLIKRFGTISVRQVNGDYRFKTDILGGEFDKTWSIPSDAKIPFAIQFLYNFI
jgi:hypothetical protein